MQTPTFPISPSRFKVFANRTFHRTSGIGLFDTRIGELVRNLFVSSLLWFLLAIAVYTVYTTIVGTH
jgi:hypothetical protein